jgi:hypothetical protein
MNETIKEQDVAQYQVQGHTARGWITSLLTPVWEEAQREKRRLLRYGVHPSAVRVVTLYVPYEIN